MTVAGNHHIISLPRTPHLSTTEDFNPREIAQQWLTSLESALSNGGFDHLRDLFHVESWWRDILALQWDFRTLQNVDAITDFVKQYQPLAQLSNFRLQDEGKYQPALDKPEEDRPGIEWLASMFFFETNVGKGAGVLRLTQDPGSGQWKAYAFYTTLQELKMAEEPLGPKRVYGTLDSLPGGVKGGTWLERRQRQQEFKDNEPQVLVVGAGKFLLFLSGRTTSIPTHFP
jgi:hypothetical protein